MQSLSWSGRTSSSLSWWRRLCWPSDTPTAQPHKPTVSHWHHRTSAVISLNHFHISQLFCVFIIYLFEINDLLKQIHFYQATRLSPPTDKTLQQLSTSEQSTKQTEIHLWIKTLERLIEDLIGAVSLNTSELQAVLDSCSCCMLLQRRMSGFYAYKSVLAPLKEQLGTEISWKQIICFLAAAGNRETASLAPSKPNKTCLPTPLKLTN